MNQPFVRTSRLASVALHPTVTWSGVCFLLAVGLAPPAGSQPANLNLTTANLTSGTTIYQATSSISTTSGYSFTVSGGANVTFQSGGSIRLWPGFTANAQSGGAYFHAYITPIVDYTISGTVTNASGGALANATVTLGGSMSGSTTTNSNGAYSLPVAPGSGYSYMVTATMAGQTFTPGSSGPFSNVSTNIAGVNFTENGTTITSLSGLQACLDGTAPYSVNTTNCPLAAMTFPVTSTINIKRYGVTLSGANTTSDHTKTRLVRGPSLKDPLIQVAVPGINQSQPTTTLAQTGLTGIVIRDLTICGGGNSHDNVDPNHRARRAIMSPPGPVSTTYPCADQHLPAQTACDYDNVCTDLSVNNIDSGYYPPDPFHYTGPYALEISNVDMEDAAGHALSLYSQGPFPYPGYNYAAQKVNDVWIHDSVIAYSAVSGIISGFNFQTYTDGFCDTYAQHKPNAFADDPSLVASRNIRIEHNTFQYNNTGPIGFAAIRWVGLRNNNFFVNYISPQNNNGGGGGVGFDDCSDQVDISKNVFMGPSAATVLWAGGALPQGYEPFPVTAALELYGRNMTMAHNTITAHGEDGIGAYSLLGATITQNHILQDNSWENPIFGGIMVGDNVAGYFAPCDTRPRDTSGVTITANDSNPTPPMPDPVAPVAPGPAMQPYGVRLQDHGAPLGTGRLFNVTVDTNNFSGTNPLYGPQGNVWLDSYVGLYNYMGQSHNDPSSSDTNPRLLPADVTDASSSTSLFTPLWPVPPLCADPVQPAPPAAPIPPPVPPGSQKGSARAKFKFSASDAQGAGNLAQIQGVWSTTGDDGDGSGGPGGTLCSFLYDAPSNQVYLWDYARQTWTTTSPSVVGPSGNELTDTGSGCIIHAGSSTSWVSEGSQQAAPKTYVNYVTLDVTLPPALAHYHMYAFVENLNPAPGNYAPCDKSGKGCPYWYYWGYWPNYQ
jgi:Carboxypeptidase regulatory-like domain